jgi:hypothetical protein
MSSKLQVREVPQLVTGSFFAEENTYINVNGKIYELTPETVNSIRKLYSDDGGGMTINDLADLIALPKTAVKKILSVLGITHDSEYFSDEELQSRDVESLALELKQKELTDIRKKIKERHIESISADAQKWVKLKESFSLLVQENSNLFTSPSGMSIEIPEVNPSTNKFSLFLPVTDFHYGKFGSDLSHTLYPYNRYVAINLLSKKVGEILSSVIKFGIPERIFLPFGSDWFHIDNFANSTTKGTPQDCDGTFDEIFMYGTKLKIELIDALKSIAPITLINMQGNHDTVATMGLYNVLWERYKDDPMVRIRDPKMPGSHDRMQSIQYGEIAIVTHHGDKIQAMGIKTQSELFANLATSPSVSSFRQVLFFTGDRHHDKTEVRSNIRWEQAPSLAGSDRYHAGEGYGSTLKALNGYLIDPNIGMFAKLMAPAAPEEYQALFKESVYR